MLGVGAEYRVVSEDSARNERVVVVVVQHLNQLVKSEVLVVIPLYVVKLPDAVAHF